MSLGPIDPEEIIRVLLEDTHEPYRHARLVALLSLCAWMRWPDDQDVVRDAQTTAAAMVFLHELNQGSGSPIPLTLEKLSNAVVHRQIWGPYSEAFDDQMVTDIVAFFMHCPEDKRPSLGKAYHFIDAGGFISSDFNEVERKQMKRGRTSLKEAWKAQARSAPLLWATLVFDEDSEVYWYAPDDIECFEQANALVKDRDRLLSFFGIALFCQQKLTRLLQTTGATDIKFPTFPQSVKPIAPDIGTFDEEQLRILGRYVAPQ